MKTINAFKNPTMCSKNFDAISMELKSSNIVISMGGIPLSNFIGAITSIENILQNCILLKNTILCKKYLGTISMEMKSANNVLQMGGKPFINVLNAISSIEYILRNCVGLNSSIICKKHLDAINLDWKASHNILSMGGKPSLQIINIISSIQYVLKNCTLTTRPISTAFIKSNFYGEDKGLDLQNTEKLDTTYGLDAQEATFQLQLPSQNPVVPKSRQGVLEASEATINLENLQQAMDKAKAEKEKADAEVLANEAVDKSDSDKIMGIPKGIFWFGVIGLTMIGGYFGYQKFIAKK